MASQMYVDLIVSELFNNDSKTNADGFNFPFVGTLNGGNVQIDALPTPIPLTEFELLVDSKTEVPPTYKNGDRLVILPANDGKQFVIIGRLI